MQMGSFGKATDLAGVRRGFLARRPAPDPLCPPKSSRHRPVFVPREGQARQGDAITILGYQRVGTPAERACSDDAIPGRRIPSIRLQLAALLIPSRLIL